MRKRVVTAIATLAVGAIVLVIGLVVRHDAVAARDWPTVPGKIVKKELVHRDKWRAYPRVEYTYVVAGHPYTGERYLRSGRIDEHDADVQRRLDALPDPVPVHYNPDDPRDAFLLENPSWTYWILVAIGAAALAWGAFQVLAIIGTRSS